MLVKVVFLIIISLLWHGILTLNVLFYKHGYSALHKASMMGHANIVKVLIQNGADVNLISKASIIAIAKFIFEILPRI